MTTCQIAHPFHLSAHNIRKTVIETVGSLAVLKIYVGILRRATYLRMLRIHAAGTECRYLVMLHKRSYIIIPYDTDSGHFIGCAPSVKHVDHRQRTFNCGEMGHKAKIHCFLYRCRHQKGESGGTCSHYILMISEYRQCMSGDRTASHMKDPGQKLTRDLKHVRYHQKQTLR